VVRRLTYNPGFDKLMADMIGFLDGAG
jgi:hypothetical protein